MFNNMLYMYNSAMLFFDIKVRNVEVSCVSAPSLLVKGVFLCLVCQLKPHTKLGASWGHNGPYMMRKNAEYAHVALRCPKSA